MVNISQTRLKGKSYNPINHPPDGTAASSLLGIHSGIETQLVRTAKDLQETCKKPTDNKLRVLILK